MRAVQVAQAGDIKLQEDLPTPTPQSSQLLVKVVASALQPADVLNAKGGFGHTTFPRIPGRDFSGIVVHSPPSSPIALGAEIFATSGSELSFTQDGAHAEFVLVPVDGVAIKPKALSFVQAAMVGTPFTTAMLTLKRTEAKKGDSVLVLGASGAVGTAVTQIAKKMGCRVIGAARRDTFEVNLQNDPNLETVKTLTNGKGVDICIDTVGNVDLMRASFNALANGGRLGIISLNGPDSILQVDVRAFYRAQHVLVGCNSVESTIAETAKFLEEMSPWFEDGQLTAPSEGSLTAVSLDELKTAYEDSISGKAKGKKFVLVNKAATKDA